MDLDAVGDITHGLYLVASHNDGKFNGQIVDALIQVSASPPTVAVAINKKTLTHEYIDKSRVFSVTALAADVPMEFIKHFGFNTGRNLDKYQNMTYEKGVTGCPVITDHSLSCMEAEVRQTLDVGTHTMFIGEVVFAKKVGDMAPITYRDYKIAKGIIAQTSPSFIPPSVAPAKPVFTLQSHSQKPPAADSDQVEKKELSETNKEENKMDKYVCTACGYVYDPEKGDPDGGVEPGTSFEKIPDDWVCPLCGVDKTFFEKQ